MPRIGRAMHSVDDRNPSHFFHLTYPEAAFRWRLLCLVFASFVLFAGCGDTASNDSTGGEEVNLEGGEEVGGESPFGSEGYDGGNCIPDCNDKVGGSDGCTGSCGVCSDGQDCDGKGQCVIPECLPDCGGKVVCADDGCGGYCGDCPASTGDCCEVHPSPGCNVASCEAAVCAQNESCCSVGWSANCVSLATEVCGLCETTPTCGDNTCNGTETCST